MKISLYGMMFIQRWWKMDNIQHLYIDGELLRRILLNILFVLGLLSCFDFVIPKELRS